VKKFFDYLKKVAVQMVVNELKNNSDKFSKKIAEKCDIPLLSEKQEAKLAETLLDGMVELIEEMYVEKPKSKPKKKKK
tara:strand:+ start:704 stop:937 length:234 start_codon:yes stop_codon:yes gene_type:complete